MDHLWTPSGPTFGRARGLMSLRTQNGAPAMDLATDDVQKWSIIGHIYGPIMDYSLLGNNCR